MKRMMLSAGLSAAVFAALAEPKIDAVSYAQAADGEVTISYTLSGEAAIVTFEVLSGGVPLAGEALRDVAFASDCWKIVEPGARSIRWRPHVTLADASSVSVKVCAWTSDNPPPVMVVDLQSATVAADRVRYYPSLGCLPGGLLENAAYRTSKLVFKKVMGVGVAGRWVRLRRCRASIRVNTPLTRSSLAITTSASSSSRRDSIGSFRLRSRRALPLTA